MHLQFILLSWLISASTVVIMQVKTIHIPILFGPICFFIRYCNKFTHNDSWSSSSKILFIISSLNANYFTFPHEIMIAICLLNLERQCGKLKHIMSFKKIEHLTWFSCSIFFFHQLLLIGQIHYQANISGSLMILLFFFNLQQFYF